MYIYVCNGKRMAFESRLVDDGSRESLCPRVRMGMAIRTVRIGGSDFHVLSNGVGYLITTGLIPREVLSY